MEASTPKDFEPFYDYAKLTEEQAVKLSDAVRKHRRIADSLSEDATTENARKFLESHADLTRMADDIEFDIFTVPAMVHVAGPAKLETNPDDPLEEGLIQRCSRCGSVLGFWKEGMMGITSSGPKILSEEDVPWLPEGQLVGKMNHPQGMNLYILDEGHKLEAHERECLQMPDFKL